MVCFHANACAASVTAHTLTDSSTRAYIQFPSKADFHSPETHSCYTHIDDLDLMEYSTNIKIFCKLYCSNKVSPFSTINPFIYAPWHTFKHTQAYTMYRFGLIGLAWSSTIMDSTMKLVSPNGAHL